MSLQRTVGCDGLVMFLGCLWTGYPNLPWDVLQLERGKEAGQEPPGGEQWWKSWRRWNLHGAKRRPKGETLAKAKDRVEWRRLIAALHQGWRDWVSERWRIQGRGRGPSFLIFRPNWGPRGEKIFFETGSPPLSQGQDDRPPFLIWRSDLPLVNESVSHSPMVTA